MVHGSNDMITIRFHPLREVVPFSVLFRGQHHHYAKFRCLVKLPSSPRVRFSLRSVLKARGLCKDLSNVDTIFDTVRVYGDLKDSDIHHMWYGHYR